MAIHPVRLSLAELHKAGVLNLEQPALLQIRRGHPPAPLQVTVDSVAQDHPQSTCRVVESLVSHLWVGCVELQRERESIEHSHRKLLVTDTGWAGHLNCAI